MKKFVIILFFTLNTTLIPQEISLGSSFGSSFENANFKNLPQLENCCDNYNSEFGTLFSIDTYLRFYIEDMKFFISPSFMTNKTNFSKDINEVINIGGEAYDGLIRHSLSTETNFINLDFGYEGNLYSRLNYRAGFSTGIRTSITANQREILIEPDDKGVFENGTRTRNETKEIYTESRFNYGLNLGLSAKYHLDNSDKLFLEPFVNLRYYLNNNFDDLNWNTGFAQLGVSVTYSFTKKEITQKKIPNPEIDLIAFKTKEEKREKLKIIDLNYLTATDVLSGESFYLYRKSDYKISFFTYVNNLLDRKVYFTLMNNNGDTLYSDETIQNNFSKEFNPLTLSKIISSEELQLKINIADSSKTILSEERNYKISTNNVGDINIISTSVIDKFVIDYINDNSEKTFTVYSNQKNIFKNKSISNPNIVVKNLSFLPYLNERNKINKFFIVIE